MKEILILIVPYYLLFSCNTVIEDNSQILNRIEDYIFEDTVEEGNNPLEAYFLKSVASFNDKFLYFQTQIEKRK